MPMIAQFDRYENLADKKWLEAEVEQFHSVDNDTPRALSPEAEKQMWRKVDLRLMPILTLMYLLCFMDRGGSDSFN